MSASVSQLRSNSSASALLNDRLLTRFSWLRAMQEDHSEQALEPRSEHDTVPHLEGERSYSRAEEQEDIQRRSSACSR
jgi:hypothetical protein